MMFWLGFILPCCYVVGVTGASIATQWVVLSAVLPQALWRAGRFTAAHGIGLVFIGYALLTLFWSVSWPDTVGGLWVVGIWALSFWLGSTVEDLGDLWRGLAVGLMVNVAVQVLQALGFHLVPVVVEDIGPAFVDRNAGLLFNPNLLAVSIALVVIGLISVRSYWHIPVLLPGLWLAHSRGGWLVLGVGISARYLHWAVVPAMVGGAGAFFVFYPDLSNGLRLQLWQAVFGELNLFGHGAGTFVDLWYQVGNPGSPLRYQFIHPEFAHNDYLQLAFEYGLGAMAVYCVLGWALSRTSSAGWPVLVGFAVSGLFFYPLYCGLTAFIGCVVAGSVVRDWAVFCDYRDHCRSLVLQGAIDRAAELARQATVPVEP